LRSPERQFGPGNAVGILFVKECRSIASGRAFWALLLLLCPLVGYSYTQAVALYAEASRSAGQLPEVARNISPLDGILVPTFGALYLANTFLFPFVAIRSVALEKETGSLKLLLQLPPSLGTVLSAKMAALTGAWLVVAALPITAVALWMLPGGHVAPAELGNLLLGHWLYGAVVIGFALVAAALAESSATAAIITLAITLGFWVLDFAGAGNAGILKSLANLSLTALLRAFERGIFSLGSVFGALVTAVGLAVVAGILIDLKRPAVWKVGIAITTLVGAALLIVGAAQLHVYADASEDRRNSFAVADAETLSGLKQRLTVVVRLAPEDPRYIDFARNILGKLERTMPDVKIVLQSQSRTGALEEASEKYGTMVYHYGGRQAESRSTGTGEILPLIYDLAKVERKSTPPVPAYPGYPLEAGTRAAEIWFYGVLPLLIIAAWIATQGLIPIIRPASRTANANVLSAEPGANAKGDLT
jgi:ABC-type transport system involved in multi-copper enzyme maturation permease subunit